MLQRTLLYSSAQSTDDIFPSLISAVVESASFVKTCGDSYLEEDADNQGSLIFWWCAVTVLCVIPVFADIPSSLSICLWDPLLNQNRHLWPDTMDSIVSPWKESMCFANAALAAANLRDNFCIQPLIKEQSFAWMTSSKVPGGCGKGPVSKCGLNRGPFGPQWMDYTDHRDTESSWGKGFTVVHETKACV